MAPGSGITRRLQGMSVCSYTLVRCILTDIVASTPAPALVTRVPRGGWLAWATGLLALLACVLSLLAVQSLARDAAPFFHAEAIEASNPAPAGTLEAEKDSLDRDWALVPAMQFEAGLPLPAADTVRPMRPQFQAPPPQRPPRARA